MFHFANKHQFVRASISRNVAVNKLSTNHGTKYPSSMDLGDKFYDRLLKKKDVKERRAENKAMYPPQAQFMAMLPPMGNADGYQFKLYWDGVYGKLPDLPVDPDLLMQKFLKEGDPDCVIWLMVCLCIRTIIWLDFVACLLFCSRSLCLIAIL